MKDEFKIYRLDNFGRGISYYNGKVIFIENALDGENIEAEVKEVKKNIYEADTIRVIDKSYETTMDEAKKVKKYLETNLTNTSIVLGPTTCSVFKYYNEYRMQIIIKYQRDDKLMSVLKDLDNIYINKNTKLEIDFNPLKI